MTPLARDVLHTMSRGMTGEWVEMGKRDRSFAVLKFGQVDLLHNFKKKMEIVYTLIMRYQLPSYIKEISIFVHFI